ncbi:TetR/AcrR family transcriptional regulator [Sphaerisporangium rhizosphaerae]|uniref:TetR/AcrR family transcriptional regulator n=1 Tax=Sphaerisporangium rhizosphaerae TaxID=2269375 RepID=A0ABW2P5U1_9ACTN
MGAVSTTAARSHVQRLRADASRNRERIVAAAREAFVEYGAEVTLDQIARRAGVGNATIYRHFADRPELIRQVTLEVMNRIVKLAETALAEEPDAFAALRRFVHGATEERIGALCPILSADCERIASALTVERARLERAVEAIVERGRDAGLLRPDVTPADILIALSQLTRPLPGSRRLNLDRFVGRHLELFLDGLRTPARSPLPGAGATFDDLKRRPPTTTTPTA